MSDSNAFINNYIDVIVGTTHEQLNTIFQLKTKEKMIDGLIKEKDETIASLQNQLEEVKQTSLQNHEAKNSLNSEIESLRTNAKIWEESYNAMKGKVAHLDGITAQLNQFKQDIIAKNNEIDRLNKEIATLKNKSTAKEAKKELEKEVEKKPIEEELNTKSKGAKKDLVIEKEIKTPTLDDF